MSWKKSGILLPCLLVAACGAKQEETTVVEGETSVDVDATVVEARVVVYEESILKVENDDGTVEMYDATELEVLAPESLTGKKLFICHRPPADQDSVWRSLGAKVVFELAEEDINPVGCAFVTDEAVEVREVGGE
jgi:hypothetical protein